VSAYLDAGLAYKGLIPGRDDDTVGLSVAYARLGDDARRADTDMIRVTGQAMPRRRAESIVEATYQAVVVPGFTLQPDAQLVLHPGGGIANPRDPNAGRVKNAVVLGMRATVQY
jgi:porin